MDAQNIVGNIPQLVLTLPITGLTVSMNQYLTTGQNRQLQKFLLENTQIDGEGKIQKLDTASYLVMQDKAAELLIKKVSDKDGNVIPFSLEWLSDLPSDDGDAIYKAIDERMNLSRLSKDDKKKS